MAKEHPRDRLLSLDAREDAARRHYQEHLSVWGDFGLVAEVRAEDPPTLEGEAPEKAESRKRLVAFLRAVEAKRAFAVKLLRGEAGS